MREADFQKQVIDLAHLHRWTVAHFRAARTKDGGWITPVAADGKGFPDLVLAHPTGGVIFAELKSEKGRLSYDQQAWIEVLDAAGAEAYVWRPDDLDAIHTRLARTR